MSPTHRVLTTAQDALGAARDGDDGLSTLTHLAAAVETLTATRHELFNLLA